MTFITEAPSTVRALQQTLPEWPAFEAFYQETLYREVYRENWLLAKLGAFLLRRGGKKIRPLLLLYTAKACGQITEKTFVAGTLVELLHNATLVHDDVVDDSDYRRGFFSLRALWGNRIAVLFGDWLLARGLLIALRYQVPELLHYTAQAVEALSEGELLQLKRMREANLSLESYFTVIEKKTAALFEAACAMGAWTSGASADRLLTAQAIGRAIGIAFQIRDDLLDWSESTLTGKPTDTDRTQKRFTLPLLWAAQRLSPTERRALFRAPFREAQRRLHEMGAFAYAEERLREYTQQAQTLAASLPHHHTVPLTQLLHLLAYRSQ
ncbi:MAG: polyprenyl synthetase family protein [Bacteroidia bacterium]|jgi:octaprenyl-diphosphate synthase|nr:polyprenyl synthetase family protein [Bacteroidia bacterium]GIV24110.1 MAG: polyprenyl synthetase [Bacteroidia bacterium]